MQVLFKLFILLSLGMCLNFDLRAQSNVFDLAELKFPNRLSLVSFGNTSKNYAVFNELSADYFDKNSLMKPTGEGIHFDAFFCKMEVRLRNKLKVWVKIHAGDYDAYTKDIYSR